MRTAQTNTVQLEKKAGTSAFVVSAKREDSAYYEPELISKRIGLRSFIQFCHLGILKHSFKTWYDVNGGRRVATQESLLGIEIITSIVRYLLTFPQ